MMNYKGWLMNKKTLYTPIFVKILRGLFFHHPSFIFLFQGLKSNFSLKSSLKWLKTGSNVGFLT
jgi:hypothetical protein